MEKGFLINPGDIFSAVPQSTIKSILPGIVTIKKLCDGLEISLSDFFNTDVFSNLEQELT